MRGRAGAGRERDRRKIPSERSFYRYAEEESVRHVLQCMLTSVRERVIAAGLGD